MSALTVREVKDALPDKFKNKINEETVKGITTVLNDPVYFNQYRENFITYASVLQDGRFKMRDYLNAVKYCTQKLMGASNNEAYRKTFPNRYKSMLQKGHSAKDIASITTAYNKSKLVNAILEQSIIPTWIINQDLYQKAVNIQAEIMLDEDVSPKVRSDAANSLMSHLKPPETQKIELNVSKNESKEVQQLKDMLGVLAAKQSSMLQSGLVDVKEVAESNLVPKVIEHE